MASPRVYSLNVDEALLVISSYSRALSEGRDCRAARAEAECLISVILEAISQGSPVKANKKKWLVFRQLLETLAFKVYMCAMGSLDYFPGGLEQAKTFLENDPFLKAFNCIDRVQIKNVRDEAAKKNQDPRTPQGPPEEKSASSAPNEETLLQMQQMEKQLEDQKKMVSYFETELRFKALEVVRLQDSLVSSMQLREAACREKEATDQLLAADRKRSLDLQREYATLQTEHTSLVKKLETEREVSQVLKQRLEKLNLVHKEQEETKDLVLQIRNRQEEMFEDMVERSTAADNTESEAPCLPPDVKEVCDQIQYFIGGNCSVFGEKLLGRHFSRQDYESDQDSCVCFATCAVFWRMIKKWADSSEGSVTKEHLLTACVELSPNPCTVERMSPAKRGCLETSFTFLLRHVLVSETLPWLRTTGRLSEDARMYVEQGATKVVKLDRLLLVLQSLGEQGFHLFMKALEDSKQSLVSRHLDACFQESCSEAPTPAPAVDVAQAPSASSCQPLSLSWDSGGAHSFLGCPSYPIRTDGPSDVTNSISETLQAGRSYDVNADFLRRVRELEFACQSVLRTPPAPRMTTSMTSSWDTLQSFELFGSGRNPLSTERLQKDENE